MDPAERDPDEDETAGKLGGDPSDADARALARRLLRSAGEIIARTEPKPQPSDGQPQP